jgi:hypothetical protein
MKPFSIYIYNTSVINDITFCFVQSNKDIVLLYNDYNIENITKNEWNTCITRMLDVSIHKNKEVSKALDKTKNYIFSTR